MLVAFDFSNEYEPYMLRSETDALLALLAEHHSEMRTDNGWRAKPAPEPDIVEPEPPIAPVAPPLPPPEWRLNPVQHMTAELHRIAQEHGVCASSVKGPSRFSEHVLARNQLMYDLRRVGLSSASIGRFLGKDHSTVLHGCAQHAKRLAKLSDDHALISAAGLSAL